MPAYTVPGVYVQESPLTALTTSSGGQALAAFFGVAERGPTTPTLISDWPSYQSLFGAINDSYDLGYAVYHYFANGGRSCYVARVVAAAAVPANSLTADTEGVQWTPAGGTAATLFDVTANSPGTWGNSLTVQAIGGSIAPTDSAFGTFTVVVELGGVEVERWVDCSLVASSPRYVQSVVNTYSNFITVSNVNPAGDVPDADDAFVATKFALDDGTDGTVADGDYSTALNGLDTIEGNLIINLPGVTSATPVAAAVTKAGARNDSFVIIDPDTSDVSFAEVQATAANFATVSPLSYAAHYAPALQMVDPAKTGPTAVRTTAPGGAIAGLYVRNDANRTVAKAPAGYNTNIVGAYSTSIKLTPTQVGSLYTDSVPVNTFKVIPGGGVVVNGARTLAKVDPDKFIQVRRTLNYLKFSLQELTEFATFESNDERLWERLRQTTTSFLGAFWRLGGLAGDRSTEAFYVICDETNNTAGTIANGEVHVEVGVATTSPAEFIVINLSQWTGGASQATESS